MGREFPQGQDQNAVEIHPFLTISLFIASVAATVAVVSSLCGALSRKKTLTSPVPVQNQGKMEENRDNHNIHVSPARTDDNISSNNYGSPAMDYSSASPDDRNEEFLQQPLPPPPGKQNLKGPGAASYHVRSNSTASNSSKSSQLKKLPTSMSMRALGSGIGSKLLSRKDHDSNNGDDNNQNRKNRDKKLKHEDSIWKKTIILGEKCKVPDEDDEDAILYDEKGNRIPAYHRKTTSVALSRQNSGIDLDAIPSSSTVDQMGPRDEALRNAFVGSN
ncbi:OLC1v1029274C1 [Oldenlandia corymbosa var. corymbosa]|uniref:OLC1v1029274C1 n=1 Tax=Oldenlandia corymbosa var. corymbosa TaxID=529605 RepID=A0AAV1CGW4_OLDCO|nr:OLC1v1029274C1 [Oldenlandia corymbosa var. corymbosa]